MNDDELRDHLWSTLEPVSSPTPELARLRRIARRRRRRQQGTAATLGLLLLAGAGVGIAEATSGNPGRAVLTAGPTPSTVQGDVTVPCRTTAVSLQVGQTLHVAPCSDVSGHRVGAVPATGTAVSQTGRSIFHADEQGTSELQIEYIGCAGPPLTPCLSDQQLIGSITVNVGVHSGPAGDVVGAPCKGGRVSVSVGHELALLSCPVGLQSKVDDPSVLAPTNAPSNFSALKPGVTNVELYVKPQCSPGMMCPQYVRDLGTLVVTVTPSG